MDLGSPVWIVREADGHYGRVLGVFSSEDEVESFLADTEGTLSEDVIYASFPIGYGWDRGSGQGTYTDTV